MQIIDATRRWVERGRHWTPVYGPFAEEASTGSGRRCRFYVSEGAPPPAGLLENLRSELLHLYGAGRAPQCETTLLIHPWVLNDLCRIQ